MSSQLTLSSPTFIRSTDRPLSVGDSLKNDARLTLRVHLSPNLVLPLASYIVICQPLVLVFDWIIAFIRA